MLKEIANRRSRRIIDPQRTIDPAVIRDLLEAARWAPSCSNNQPWRFVISVAESLVQVKEALTKGNAWARQAPLIITVASNPDLDCRIKDRDYFTLGLGLAVENILLEGTSRGLVVHPIAGFSERKVKEALDIPEEYRVHVLIIIGHPGDPEKAEPDLVKRENATRERKPLGDIVFQEGWQKSFNI